MFIDDNLQAELCQSDNLYEFAYFPNFIKFYHISRQETGYRTGYRLYLSESNMEGIRGCHRKPDWLLIWKQDQDNLYLVRTGTHSDFILIFIIRRLPGDCPGFFVYACVNYDDY
ncbi:MAG TPA: type II toxin-antitoxin system YafQ family toxin, partial [Candidatus Marinimicrobia bacterium]|nr:type II toxin-antitoxin system YafQ family toxin [Candidatus Neomarinimicrobiota bacterium]